MRTPGCLAPNLYQPPAPGALRSAAEGPELHRAFGGLRHALFAVAGICVALGALLVVIAAEEFLRYTRGFSESTAILGLFAAATLVPGTLSLRAARSVELAPNRPNGLSTAIDQVRDSLAVFAVAAFMILALLLYLWQR